jgi:methionine-gamma-lyase
LISKTFVDITKLDAVEAATSDTKVLYCETVSNPLLEVADIAGLSKSQKT